MQARIECDLRCEMEVRRVRVRGDRVSSVLHEAEVRLRRLRLLLLPPRTSQLSSTYHFS